MFPVFQGFSIAMSIISLSTTSLKIIERKQIESGLHKWMVILFSDGPTTFWLNCKK